MAGLGLVPAADDAVDDLEAPLGGDDELGPAVAGVGAAVGGVGLEGTGGGGADGDHPSALVMGVVHGLRGRGRHPVALGVGRFVGLEGGHAGVQRDGSEHRRRARAQACDELGREGSAGGRHLRRAEAEVARPVGGRTPSGSRRSARRCRCSRSGSGGPARRGSRRAGPGVTTSACQSRVPPASVADEYGKRSRASPPAASGITIAVVDRVRSAAEPAGLPDLDDPAGPAEVGRQVDHHRAVVGGDRGGQGRRGVDHEHVARREGTGRGRRHGRG